MTQISIEPSSHSMYFLMHRILSTVFLATLDLIVDFRYTTTITRFCVSRVLTTQRLVGPVPYKLFHEMCIDQLQKTE